MLSSKLIPKDLAFFCATLSPFTNDERVFQLRQSAQKGGIDWEAVAQLANRSELAPALYSSLKAKELLEYVPELLRDYLGEMYHFNLERNNALKRQLLDIIEQFNDASITPLLFKGSAALLTNIYPDPGIRFMWDLDLLIPEEKLSQAATILENNDYRITENSEHELPEEIDWSSKHHLPPMICTGETGSVELHRRLLLNECTQELVTKKVWEESQPFTHELTGSSAELLSPTHAVLHCFVHAQIHHHNHRYAKIDYRQMLQFSLLIDRYRDEIDWNTLSEFIDDPESGSSFKAYLYIAEQLFRVQTPLATAPDQATLNYFSRTMGQREGWRKHLNVARTFLYDLVKAFSAEKLRNNQSPDQDASLSRLRLRHFLFLLRKYSRITAWRKKSNRIA